MSAAATPAHAAVAMEDLTHPRDLLDGGADVEEVDGGLPLLQHAIDVEGLTVTCRLAGTLTST